MNGRKAKGLKKTIYGDFSLKERDYARQPTGSVYNTGKRAAYQKLKKDSHKQSGGSKHITKGKNRPRWLYPKKRDQ